MENKKNKQEARKSTPTVSTILPSGDVVELVYDPVKQRTALAVGSPRGFSIEDSIEFGGTILTPWNAAHILIRQENILLPQRPEPFGTVSDLIAEIDQHIARYVDLSEDLRTVIAGYVLLAWVYDAFSELPYLRFRGDLGSGKSRALMVIGSLCYKSFIASGASTVSPLFHTLDTFRGTLLLDEADFRFSDEKAELSKILNNGNLRGFPVYRSMMNAQKEFEPRSFNVYGPKVIAMRGRFDDAALESRFITIDMEVPSDAPRSPINLPDAHREEARRLRNKLLAYRFANRLAVSIDESLYDKALTPRANQVILPLLSIIKGTKLHEATRGLVLETQADTLAERAASPAGQLVALLLDLACEEGLTTIPMAELTRRFTERYGGDYDRPISTRYLGALLRRSLDIRPYQLHGIFQVPLHRERLKSRGARYGAQSAVADRGEQGELGDLRADRQAH